MTTNSETLTYSSTHSIVNGTFKEVNPDHQKGALRGAQLLVKALIAEGYKIQAERVIHKEQFAAAYERMLADPQQPCLLDVVVEFEENVFPMIPAGGSYRDIIMNKDSLESVDGDSQGSNI